MLAFAILLAEQRWRGKGKVRGKRTFSSKGGRRGGFKGRPSWSFKGSSLTPRALAGGKGGKRPKGSGKGCFRCGSPEHWADQCPLPKGKGKGKGKPFYSGFDSDFGDCESDYVSDSYLHNAYGCWGTEEDEGFVFWARETSN